MLAPIAALADGGSGSSSSGDSGQTYVTPGLLEKAKQNGNQKLHVIVQSVNGVGDATSKVTGLGNVRKQLNLIGAVAMDVTAGKLATLAAQPGLVITPDSPVHLTGNSALYSSSQMWPYESGAATLWPTATAPGSALPTIAIVDSGLQPRSDFGTRAYPQVNLSSLSPGATGDDRGHGTFVAGIAAGEAPGYAGTSPTAPILPIRVMDNTGRALTSDVIAALQWILANKDAYNIRVVNLSLHSGTATHFYFDPLDKAAEKLWFNGIVVVAAAGNYGLATGPSGVPFSPGNDPFILTVGAVDLGNTIGIGNDVAPTWSAYGYTPDGFAKPELGAPGRYMVGPIPAGSTLAAEKAANVKAPGYIELSGTSFAAPVVAGAAAQLIARHPGWTPDQVKGALMVTAKGAPNAAPGSVGVGQVNIGKAASLSSPPNANAAIDRFLVSDPLGGRTFDYTTWHNVAIANASWAAASWADASWAAASWSAASWASASWATASWAAASWADASWADASWATASWADSSREDAVAGETVAAVPTMDAQAMLDVLADPDLAAALAPTSTSSTSSVSTTTSSTSSVSTTTSSTSSVSTTTSSTSSVSTAAPLP